jgi:hypothetical protein
MTRMPTPAQWVLEKMTEYEVAEMLERHIDFVDNEGNSVHLASPFVRHYMNRDDGGLPTVVAISTLPIVLAVGDLLAPDGLDRLRGIIFKIEPALRKILPKRSDCNDIAVCEAMRFLTEEWLADVACDYAGKCVLIAMALTLIERSMLDQRPPWFVTAGRRGSGKTTTITMLIEAVTGIAPAAAAWSTNEEERRKALLSFFMHGVSYILWDNITRGSQISCPHVEKSCTAAYYADRKLGVSEMVATAASTIHIFTGNNIAPKGDLASRSLQVRLEVDRVDPENRDFRHPDPIEWTRANRAEILQAFYAILLGNPSLKLPQQAPMKTRFKMWQRLVGSAVEHAAKLHADDTEPGAYDAEDRHKPVPIDFGQMFLEQEDHDEESGALGQVLAVLDKQWGMMQKGFGAGEVTKFLNDRSNPEGTAALREFLLGYRPDNYVFEPRGVSSALKKHADNPVIYNNHTWTLRCPRNDTKHKGTTRFYVSKTPVQTEMEGEVG